MSVLTAVGILVLSMLIMGFLYLTPGVFALFSHYAFGKYSKKKAAELTFYFILGVETGASCIFFCVYSLIAVMVADLSHMGANIITWLILGAIFALAFISLFFYFRRGKNTELFISRKIAKNLNIHAKTAKTRSDAFILGALSSTPELLLTLPLYIVTSFEILKMSIDHPMSSLLTIIYILTPVITLFVMRWQFLKGYNLADIQRSRVHNKNFTRFLIASCYCLIAILIICFRM